MAEPDPLVCEDEVQGMVEVLPPRTVDDFVLPEGQRLAKRTRPHSLRDLAARGRTPEDVVGALAASVGLVKAAAPVAARELVNHFTWAAVATTPAVVQVQDGDLVLRPLAQESR